MEPGDENCLTLEEMNLARRWYRPVGSPFEPPSLNGPSYHLLSLGMYMCTTAFVELPIRGEEHYPRHFRRVPHVKGAAQLQKQAKPK